LIYVRVAVVPARAENVSRVVVAPLDIMEQQARPCSMNVVGAEFLPDDIKQPVMPKRG